MLTAEGPGETASEDQQSLHAYWNYPQSTAPGATTHLKAQHLSHTYTHTQFFARGNPVSIFLCPGWKVFCSALFWSLQKCTHSRLRRFIPGPCGPPRLMGRTENLWQCFACRASQIDSQVFLGRADKGCPLESCTATASPRGAQYWASYVPKMKERYCENIARCLRLREILGAVREMSAYFLFKKINKHFI